MNAEFRAGSLWADMASSFLELTVIFYHLTKAIEHLLAAIDSKR